MIIEHLVMVAYARNYIHTLFVEAPFSKPVCQTCLGEGELNTNQT
jgi:hypothetical protein